MTKVPQLGHTYQLNLKEVKSHWTYLQRELLSKKDGDFFHCLTQRWDNYVQLLTMLVRTCDYQCLLLYRLLKRMCFETGQEIPFCQIRADWTKHCRPSQLTHKVTLKSARKPNNYFYTELDSTRGEFMHWHKRFMELLSVTPTLSYVLTEIVHSFLDIYISLSRMVHFIMQLY